MTYTQSSGSSLPPSNIVNYIQSVMPYFCDYWVSYTNDNTIIAVITDLNGENVVYTFSRSGNYSSQWQVSKSNLELVETVTVNPLYLYSSENGLLLENNRSGQILEFLMILSVAVFLIWRFLRRFLWKK